MSPEPEVPEAKDTLVLANLKFKLGSCCIIVPETGKNLVRRSRRAQKIHIFKSGSILIRHVVNTD